MRPQRLVDLRLDAVLLEDRVVLGVQLHPRHQVRHDPLDQRDHPAVFQLVVDPDRGVVVGEQVAQQLDDEALLLEQDGRRPAAFHLLADLGPDLVEVGEVAEDVFLGPAGSGGADDHAAGEAVLLAELADDAAEPGALVARLDLARDADVIHRRHEDQEAARHGGMRGQPRALGAERFLDDLDEDLLPFLEQVLDLRLRPVAVALARRGRGVRRRWPGRRRPPAASAAPAPGTARASALNGGEYRLGRLGVLVVAGLEALELLDGVDDLGHVQERIALEPDVNERRLHPGQDLRDPALVDVADHAALMLALDEDLDDLVVLEDRDPRLVVAGGDDHLLVHGTHSIVRGQPQTDAHQPIRRPAGPAGPTGAIGRERGARASLAWNHPDAQLVNRLIRTLMIRPKDARAAMSDEPP